MGNTYNKHQWITHVCIDNWMTNTIIYSEIKIYRPDVYSLRLYDDYYSLTKIYKNSRLSLTII